MGAFHPLATAGVSRCLLASDHGNTESAARKSLRKSALPRLMHSNFVLTLEQCSSLSSSARTEMNMGAFYPLATAGVKPHLHAYGLGNTESATRKTLRRCARRRVVPLPLVAMLTSMAVDRPLGFSGASLCRLAYVPGNTVSAPTRPLQRSAGMARPRLWLSVMLISKCYRRVLGNATVRPPLLFGAAQQTTRHHMCLLQIAASGNASFHREAWRRW